MSPTRTERLGLFVATGFGLGLIAPFAPGTFGSSAGVLLSYATTRLDLWVQVIACLGFAIAAIPFCSVAERILGIVDDGRITADEWMLFPIAVIGIPLSTLPWWSMVVFFAVVRIIDIIKPPPARQLQSLHGGFGIVIDDFVANLYSLAVNWTIYIAFFKT